MIKEEGEIPFYRLIKLLLNNSIKKRNDLRQPCTILKVENVKNLDDLPIIDFGLYKKYREKIRDFGQISLEFTRGCPFRCKMCVNSGNLMGCYQNVRLKPVEKCIIELKAIRDSHSWLECSSIYISDMIF